MHKSMPKINGNTPPEIQNPQMLLGTSLSVKLLTWTTLVDLWSAWSYALLVLTGWRMWYAIKEC